MNICTSDYIPFCVKEKLFEAAFWSNVCQWFYRMYLRMFIDGHLQWTQRMIKLSLGWGQY